VLNLENGGQEYLEFVNDKIHSARFTNKMIQLDGGINDETIEIPNDLGINSFVIGSYITKNDLKEKLLEIKKIIN
jgi:pentose-5-phosphate-3-epimerase